MKRTLITLAFFTFIFTSCKKDYACNCTSTTLTTAYTQYGVFYPQETNVSQFNNTITDKEDEAKSKCKLFEKISVNSFGSGESYRTMTTTVECELY
ncbi:MAG: hypothetical protein WC994_00590 [Brumimicrobium sp.]